MNVGIDVRSLLEKERSGVGEYTYQILDALFRIDQKNNYFLFYNSFRKVGEDFLEEWEKFSNVHFCGFRWPNKLLNFCFKFLKWPKIDGLCLRQSQAINYSLSGAERSRRAGLDVFFIPNLNFVALSRGVKKIITVHDLSFLHYPRFFSWKRRMWHWFVNLKRLISSAEKIIAVSENTKKDLTELYKIPSEKIKVIYSGIAPHLASPQGGEVIGENLPRPSGERDGVREIEERKKKYDLPDNFILFLGTLEPRKNIEGLIRAFEILKKNYQLPITNYQLLIAGPKGWGYKNILEKIKNRSARDDIKLIDYVASEEKFAFYKLARLFVYPSFYEGFGFPPLEAAAAGTPVIVSTNSSLPEVMGEAALMVDPNNPTEMAKVMAECLSDENLRKSLIEKGKKQAEKFSWQKCAEEILLSLTKQ